MHLKLDSIEGAAAKQGAVPVAQTRTKPWKTRIAPLVRWLHIYVSMFGLLAVLFFSVTGITLNHPDWFFSGVQEMTHSEGAVEASWLGVDPDAPLDAVPDDSGVARLEIVEYLRQTHGIGGALAEFSVADWECIVAFKGPGYSADAYIDRETGDYTLTESYAGIVAVMNDLHKGRDAGPVWSAVVDISALLLTVVSVTGIVLLLYLKKRRRAGLLTVLGGAAAVIAIYVVFVP